MCSKNSVFSVFTVFTVLWVLALVSSAFAGKDGDAETDQDRSRMVRVVPDVRIGPTLVSGRLGLGGDLSIYFPPEKPLARWSSLVFNAEGVSLLPRIFFSGWIGTGGDRGAFLGLGGVFHLSDWNFIETSEVPLSSRSESEPIEFVLGLKHVRIDGDSKTGLGLRMGMRVSRKIPLWVSVELGPGSPIWGVGLSRSF